MTLLAVSFSGVLGCGAEPRNAPGALEAGAVQPAEPATHETPFTEMAKELGLDFVHSTGATGRYYFPEILGAGVATFDYDSDGDLDLYLVQSGSLDRTREPALRLGDRLYKNLLLETGSLSFEDVTETVGIAATGYGVGVAAGDYDNDGDVDLYLANYGANQLWRNSGDGTFAEVSDRARAGDDRWSANATFLDIDQDGLLDLFVGNYVTFSLAIHKDCFAASSAPDYCSPLSYQPAANRLLRNRGDGSFEDRTARSRIAVGRAATLGAASADFNRDGLPDLYVANDGYPNRLFLNAGDGTFSEDALLAGCAYNASGAPEASMGVAIADYDEDGYLDLFATHLGNETNTLYRGLGGAFFEDGTRVTGLGYPSLPLTGFGTGWLDFDGDGWLDLLVANGAVRREGIVSSDEQQSSRSKNVFDAFAQRVQLFRSTGQGQFVETPAGSSGPSVGRGLALADLDNDGDLDAVINNLEAAPYLLLNGSQQGAWLGLRLVQGEPSSAAVGATANLRLSDGRTLHRRAHASGSFASAGDPRVLFSLGSAQPVDLVVVWPDGQEESWSSPPTGEYTTLLRGAASREPSDSLGASGGGS